MHDPTGEEVKVSMHHWNIVPKPTKKQEIAPEGQKRLPKNDNLGPGPITWTVSDIAKAACLLATPPMESHFEDEQEMRRVYTLIYDVFRYKNILNQALNDITFFQQYYDLHETPPRIWLLLYDLYHRSFSKRDPALDKEVTTCFNASKLMAAEEALWCQRVKLAAAVARLRIKNSALKLSQLLPRHLRDERSIHQSDRCPVTCWVNNNKIKTPDELTTLLEKTLNLRLINESSSLRPGYFKWDSKCPQFVVFHSSIRTKLAQSVLVQKNKLIVQDRSFCIGPATFGKLLNDLELTGCVIQSHVNSPRTTAYLATILSQNAKVTGLLVFSAGSRKMEYEDYLQDLGMTNVNIYAERLIDVPPDSNFLDQVIAVFATPPNSYSAVNDPIDLVCSRGGDLSMLEVLTESEMTMEGKERVAGILEEQRKTLRFAMSRPQIQFVLYETHSELEIENEGMVQKTVREVNKVAKIKHAAQQGKLNSISYNDLHFVDSREINNNEKLLGNVYPEREESITTILSKRESIISGRSVESTDYEEKLFKNVSVPDSDIFDVPKLAEMEATASACSSLSDEGCFLALLKRKQITKLDDKYLIEMAENRGLFGNPSATSCRAKGSRTKSKKQEKSASSPPTKMRKKGKQIEINRIAAPTESSIRHSVQGPNATNTDMCPRNRSDNGIFVKVPQSRHWWTETTRHITSLRQSLVRQKLLPPLSKLEAPHVNAKLFAYSLVHKTKRVDELIAANLASPSNIPVFPRLRLTRPLKKNDKVPLPVAVTKVEFPMSTTSF